MSGPCNLHRKLRPHRRTRTRSRAINLRFSTRGLSPWVIVSPEKHKRDEEDPTSLHAAAADTSYFFFVSKNPPLQSVLFGVRTGATRPWQMFRDACPFASAYYVLILGIRTYKARNTRPIPNVHARDPRRRTEKTWGDKCSME